MGGIRSTVLALSVVALAAVAAPAQAVPYSGVYVFGDSLSDNGNLAELLGANFPNPPSYQDSFSNGPTAAAILSARLGYTLTPSLWVTGFRDVNGLFGGGNYVAGTNYAVAGATAATVAAGGLSPLINLTQQVASSRALGSADPAALYIVDIGGNDVRQAALQATGAAAVTAGVQSELAAIRSLASAGAANFLVVNVPDIGVIPEFVLGHPTLTSSATQYTLQYDRELASGLAGLGLPGTTFSTFDLYNFNTGVLLNPAAFGITNTTTPCYTNTPSSAATTAVCGAGAANIDQFAYWDAIHPTARLQALWATGFEAAIGVPEPSSVLILGVGLLGLVARARRRGERSTAGLVAAQPPG